MENQQDRHVSEGTRKGGMDGIIIDLNTRTYHPLEARGTPPKARAGSVIQIVAGRILVFGGSKPGGAQASAVSGAGASSLGLEIVDGEDHMNVHVLDILAAGPHRPGLRGMKTGAWRWLNPPAEETPEWLEASAVAAETAVRRAQRQVVDAKAHAQVSGAPGGVTAALYESEAQFDVCKWRVSSIRAEQASIANPPLSRAYAGSCVMGYRVFILGGWTRDTAMKDLVALDLEQPDERRRRFKEEFALRLERETAARAVEDAMIAREREFELRLFLAKERKREAEERKRMDDEHMFSSLPPLSQGPLVYMIQANAHTIWVRWDPVTVDAWGNELPDGKAPTYHLSMQSSYFVIVEDMRVQIAYMEKSSGAAGGGQANMLGAADDMSVESASTRTSQSYSTYGTGAGSGYGGRSSLKEKLKGLQWYYGYVKAVHDGGLFDIIYDDGAKELKVPRWRIRPEKEPPWQLLYVGQNTK
mmetsp:Transcript_86535/g.244550  ORF Transcript_86535/g.244550 Transcript_86535/m.244550 type:complete len:473 (-) Transcript_86535:752-2170(-)